jgi:integrase/recombinase XerD
MTTLAPTLEAYFTDRLPLPAAREPEYGGRYRDAFRLLLGFVQQNPAPRHRGSSSRSSTRQRSARSSSTSNMNAATQRGTRNIRLAAIHSFVQYCALRHPEHAALMQRALAIPPLRGEKRTVTFLTADEVRRCSTLRTARRGRDDAITRSC